MTEKCSVPMWLNGCPAGTCDRPAYGVRPPSRMWMNYSAGRMMREDGRFDGYVPGLACYEHGGPQYPACKGTNCGCTDGRSHSPECQAEHEAAYSGAATHP